MKKFLLPVLAALLALSIQFAPISARAEGAAAAMPYGTASPRDWDKKAPQGELLDTAVKAEAAILMDEKTGKILFEKNADARLYPASITKIMTCLLAVEYIKSGHKMSELVTVGTLPKLPSGYVNIGLKSGETLPLETLLYALMLPSANDAANAIAIHVGGNIEAFVQMMNDKAQQLGMINTHYTNPYGLHNTEHYTSARDMALLAKEARKYPEFTKLTSTFKYTAPATNEHDAWKWENHNKLINPNKGEAYGYIYATGVKTGYTDPARYTLVSSAKKDNMSLIGVILKDGKPDYWVDSVTMLEYGFQFYDTLDLKKLLSSQAIDPLEVKNAAGTDPGQGVLQLTLLPKTVNAYITDQKEIISGLRADPSQFVANVQITKDTAPIAQDEVVGTVTFSYKESVVYECDLLASREVKEMPTPAPTTAQSESSSNSKGSKPSSIAVQSGNPSDDGSESGGGGSILVWVGVVVLVLALAMVAIRLVNMQKRNRKYRQYNYRQGSAKMKR